MDADADCKIHYNKSVGDVDHWCQPDTEVHLLRSVCEYDTCTGVCVVLHTGLGLHSVSQAIEQTEILFCS